MSLLMGGDGSRTRGRARAADRLPARSVRLDRGAAVLHDEAKAAGAYDDVFEHDYGADQSGVIILIEDDVNVANAWGLLLEAEGYRVATAASAKEARAIIGHLDELPALVISDFHLLDGSTGVEAIKTIRNYYRLNIPAFIVSGDTSKVVKDARPLDNCTMMNKPVNTARLLSGAAIATRTGRVPAD